MRIKITDDRSARSLTGLKRGEFKRLAQEMGRVWIEGGGKRPLFKREGRHGYFMTTKATLESKSGQRRWGRRRKKKQNSTKAGGGSLTKALKRPATTISSHKLGSVTRRRTQDS